MSIKIHHGPPGSYKTAGAVTDDLIPMLLNCCDNKKDTKDYKVRPLVTNVRGITMDKIHENFPDISLDFELIWIDTTTREGREKLGAWFTWAPFGALIFIDEGQAIFPKRWKESDLQKFTIDVDEAKTLNRPANWWDAWDMHRHFNWDVIITTPDISKIRDDIRDASELAYKHKNQGLYGSFFKGSYLEGVHSKDNNGANASNFINVKQKRIKKDALTWKLYESTATGEVTETIAGFNIFSNPRLLIGLAVIVCCVGYFSVNGWHVLDASQNNKLPVTKNNPSNQVAVSKDTLAPVYNVARSGSVRSSDTYDYGELESTVQLEEKPKLHPLDHLTFTYNGMFKSGRKIVYFFNTFDGVKHDSLNSDDLRAYGYALKQTSQCSFTLLYNLESMHIACAV